MTAAAFFWFFFQCLMRPWLGGAFTTPSSQGGFLDVNHTFRRLLAKVPTGVVYVVMLVSGFMLADAPIWCWGAAASLAVLLTYRAMGHGYILQFPPRTSRGDFITTIVEDIFTDSNVGRYLGYLFVRYTLLMLGFAFPLYRYCGADVTAWLLAAFSIPFIYYVCVRFLPNVGDLKVYPHHIAEFGMSIVIALALLLMW